MGSIPAASGSHARCPRPARNWDGSLMRRPQKPHAPGLHACSSPAAPRRCWPRCAALS